MDKEKNVAQVEEREFTEEQTKTQLRMFEGDFIKGLIAAADYKTEETQRIEIIRNGVLFFAFNIRALGEEEYNKCKTKHTKYVRNKQLGIKLPEDTNTVKYRSAIIYEATAKEDRDKLWDNKSVWDALNDKGCQIIRFRSFCRCTCTGIRKCKYQCRYAGREFQICGSCCRGDEV